MIVFIIRKRTLGGMIVEIGNGDTDITCLTALADIIEGIYQFNKGFPKNLNSGGITAFTIHRTGSIYDDNNINAGIIRNTLSRKLYLGKTGIKPVETGCRLINAYRARIRIIRVLGVIYFKSERTIGDTIDIGDRTIGVNANGRETSIAIYHAEGDGYILCDGCTVYTVGKIQSRTYIH